MSLIHRQAQISNYSDSGKVEVAACYSFLHHVTVFCIFCYTLWIRENRIKPLPYGHMVTIWLPYRKHPKTRCWDDLRCLSLTSLPSLPSFQVFQVLALHAHCPPPVAAREASQVAGSKGLEDVPLNMFYWHWIYCITLTRIVRIVLYYTISFHTTSYFT